MKCKICHHLYHAEFAPQYYIHARVHAGEVFLNKVDVTEQQPERDMTWDEFSHHYLPVLLTVQNASCSGMLKFIREYERNRPQGDSAEALRSIPSSTSTIRSYQKHAAQHLRQIIRSTVCAHDYFGLAIDAGIDTTLCQHVLISVIRGRTPVSSSTVVPPTA
eukprot:PhM_4_TR2431/c0_g1_i1/m.50704